MDSLVNYAGEISIYRARMEQQLTTVRFNLKEVRQTVSRLKEQLRKMDMETEAQMLSRYQNASSQGKTEFDPLELDRFSNMQQLSRAITESVSDLLNLQDMLEDSVRQTESMLVQQSRVSSDLQEGLMQTRMTPFGSAAPRLRRVVRAAAAETGKKARLQLKMAGSSDQLDRNVLERITAPLEHMLRNAVVHGIEAPKARRKQNKTRGRRDHGDGGSRSHGVRCTRGRRWQRCEPRCRAQARRRARHDPGGRGRSRRKRCSASSWKAASRPQRR